MLNSLILHLEHLTAHQHPHNYTHTHTEVGSFIVLMLFLMALFLPLHIDVTSIRPVPLGLFSTILHRLQRDPPVQSQSPPDKLHILADLSQSLCTLTQQPIWEEQGARGEALTEAYAPTCLLPQKYTRAHTQLSYQHT